MGNLFLVMAGGALDAGARHLIGRWTLVAFGRGARVTRYTLVRSVA